VGGPSGGGAAATGGGGARRGRGRRGALHNPTQAGAWVPSPAPSPSPLLTSASAPPGREAWAGGILEFSSEKKSLFDVTNPFSAGAGAR